MPDATPIKHTALNKAVLDATERRLRAAFRVSPTVTTESFTIGGGAGDTPADRQAALRKQIETRSAPARLRANPVDAIERRLRRIGVPVPAARTAAQERTDRSFAVTEARGTPAAVGLERIIGRNELLGVQYLAAGLAAARAVGRVVIRSAGGGVLGYGTGFLVSPRLLMTNNHVLATAAEAAASVVEFNFQNGRDGEADPEAHVRPRPGRRSSSPARSPTSTSPWSPSSRSGTPASRWPSSGSTPWSPSRDEVLDGESVTIIQHPNGEPKQVALRENRVLKLPDTEDRFLHYQTDTTPGLVRVPGVQRPVGGGGPAPLRVPGARRPGQLPDPGGRGVDGRHGRAPDPLDRQRGHPGGRPAGVLPGRPQLDRRAGPAPRRDPQPARADDPRGRGHPPGPAARSEPPTRRPGRDGRAGRSRSRWPWTWARQRSSPPPARRPRPRSRRRRSRPRPRRRADRCPGPDRGRDRRSRGRVRAGQTRVYFDTAADAEGPARPTTRACRPTATPAALYDRAPRPAPEDPRDQAGVQADQARLPVGGPAAEPEAQERLLRAGVRAPGVHPAGRRGRAGPAGAVGSLPGRRGSGRPRRWRPPASTSSRPSCRSTASTSSRSRGSTRRSRCAGDLHHLFACESGCNSFRGNIPYFDFPTSWRRSGTGCGRREGNKFEPTAGKGAVARATLYFLLRYPGQINETAAEYKPDRIKTLVAWHKQFPVDEYERHRNQAIFAVQGNRNPLIDHPEWADKIDFEKGLG